MNVDFPLNFNARARTADTSDVDHIRDMIEQILFTNPGERVNRPDFGSGAMQLVFQGNSPELAASLQFTVQAALQRWMGNLIDVQELEVTSEDSKLNVSIKYVIRRTQVVDVAQFPRGAGR